MSTQQKKQLNDGDILFREGDRGDHAYYIEDGEVEIIKNMDAPTEKVIQIIGKGELIGEMAVLEDRLRTASARIKSQATIVQMDRSTFLARITKDPNAAMRIMKTLSDRLRASTTLQQSHDLQNNEYSEDKPQAFDNVNDNLAQFYSERFNRKTLLAASALCAITFGTIVSSMIIEVETTVSAFAKIVPATPNLTIEAQTDGLLEDVLISAGETVEKNQIIAKMNISGIEAEIKSLKTELESTQKRLDRLNEEKKILTQNDGTDLTGIDDNVLLARLNRRNSQILVFEQNLKIAKADLEHKKSELVVAKSEHEIAKTQSKMMSADKVKRGIISQMDHLDSKTALAESERKLIENRSSITELEGSIEKMNAEKNAFVSQWNADIENELEVDTAKTLTLSARLERLQIDKEMHVIRSPIEGKILELLARREGTFLSKGHPIAAVTRSNQKLVVEAEVAPKDIEAVVTGLPVSYKVDSLPFQRYGDIKGTITRVDEDAVASHRTGINDEFYMVRIELEADKPRSAPEDFKLRRGMTGKADMITGERTILSYLLDPLLGAMRTAFRES